MTTAATISAKLVLESQEYNKGLDNAVTKSKTAGANIGKNLSKIGSSMQQVGGAMTVGVTLPIVAGFGMVAQAAMDSEAVMAEVDAVLKSTGGSAGVTKESLIEYADAMQKVTKFDDEAILSGQSMLLTFTNIGKDVFPEASTAMLNMAEKFGSMDTASTQLGKALNDPIAGVSALQRIGVTLSTQQEEQIKSFMAVNDIAGAQGIIIAELNKEFGGLAEAAGSTTTGQLTIMQNQLGNLAEQFGVILIPILIEFMKALLPVIQGFVDMDPAGQKTIMVVMGIIAALGPIVSVISTVVSAVGGLITMFGGVSAAGAGVATASAGATAAVGGVGAAAATAALPVIALVAAIGLLIYVVVKFGADAWNTVQNVIKIFQMLAQIVSWKLNDIRNALAQWIVNGIKSVINIVREVGGVAESSMNRFKNGVDSVKRGLQSAIEWIQRMRDRLASLVIPDWLTPGSPTPLETGLNGISNAMRNLSAVELPSLKQNISVLPTNVSSSKSEAAQMQPSYPTAKDIGRAVVESFMQMGIAQ